MKLIIVAALALVAAAAAAPADVPAPVEIVSSVNEQSPDGSYNFNYEASNGIKREEQGEVKEVPNEEGKPQKVVTVRGQYSFPGEDGQPESVQYFADETGYHAEGRSIPKPARR